MRHPKAAGSNPAPRIFIFKMITQKRRRKTYKIIKKRIKSIKDEDFPEDRCLQQPNRLNKRRAFGCNRSKCRLCHPEKQKKNRQEYIGDMV